MKSYRKELWFNIPTRRAFINITPQVEECLRESGIQEGLMLVNPMHITASVYVNDAEPGLYQELFVTPVTSPSSASLRKQRRHSANFRM